jgi:hypothetical protein
MQKDRGTMQTDQPDQQRRAGTLPVNHKPIMAQADHTVA